MKTLRFIAFLLTVVGAINWALVGLFHFDLVAALFGNMSLITRILYILVGISGAYILVDMHGHLFDE